MEKNPEKNPASKKKPSRKITGLRAQDPYLEREKGRYEFPLPSREYILQILADRGAPIMAEELAQLLSINDDEMVAFERRMQAMGREGQLLLNRKGALCLPEKLDLIPGKVQGHPDGFGFLVRDDGGDDLFLGPKEMDKVLHGDRVLARLIGVDRRGRPEGSIAEVLEHVNQRLVGRMHNERGVFFVTAEDKRISRDILLEAKNTGGAKAGQVVMVELLVQPSRYSQPVGRVIELLGNYDDPGMEIEIALRKHNLPHVFSPEAQAQADATPQKVKKKDWKPVQGVERVDLRDLPLVTIDGETARDFDDAVFAEKKGKGWRLVVAIADVSHYVTPNDALDLTAIERGNSVYFPRRVIPMLPEALSNGVCSLNPDVERLCMVCDMRVTQSGEIKKYQFYPAVMLSKARLTYTRVWDMLQNPKGSDAQANTHLLPHLNTLYDLFQTFVKARHERGAIDFETQETEMRFDEFGKITQIVPVVRNDAHKLIEECMLAANVCAADYLIKNEHVGLYRVHEGPTPEKLKNLREYLRTMGLSLGGAEDPGAKDYAQLLDSIKNRPDAPLLQTMLLRSLSQAVYAPDNEGHFGLSYEAYAHFTSPIRRYPDLLVHRSIKAILAGKTYKPATKWEQLGVQCSMTERRADEASRDVQNWLKCYYMQDKIGEEFMGSVSAVTGFGMFVLLDDLYVEGLVHVSELGTDYFHYDEKRKELKGERSGKVYRITERVKVRVVRVDLETSKIDFALVDEAGRLLGAKSAPRGEGGKPVARQAGNAKTTSSTRSRGAKTASAGSRTSATPVTPKATTVLAAEGEVLQKKAKKPGTATQRRRAQAAQGDTTPKTGTRRRRR
ncbi:ribonuclease R [Chitinibacter sp. S2-10]|uniref:ribonuclease R n=1 Tax=Chitinibacter sp. S2-10 TaxID=3373597 RepID=UPI003977DB82